MIQAQSPERAGREPLLRERGPSGGTDRSRQNTLERRPTAKVTQKITRLTLPPHRTVNFCSQCWLIGGFSTLLILNSLIRIGAMARVAFESDVCCGWQQCARYFCVTLTCSYNVRTGDDLCLQH
jgi:hypothetical protein